MINAQFIYQREFPRLTQKEVFVFPVYPFFDMGYHCKSWDIFAIGNSLPYPAFFFGLEMLIETDAEH